MTARTEQVLGFLREVGFETRMGSIAPFGEELPLIGGTAWDPRTAQVALVAETEGEIEVDSWSQVLFASSGLRHHLSRDRASAFGTPVVLAIVDDVGERALRNLADDLADRYVLFNRVDLNLVRAESIADPTLLADSLAPLLPRCREALARGSTIATKEIRDFWRILREEIETSAQRLDPVFGSAREAAAKKVADQLIGDLESRVELPAIDPIRHLQARHFRSFRDLSLDLEQVTIVHGPNGGGKSSLLEALELAWTGTSQRKPHGVTAEEYQRHLPRGGEGRFEVAADRSEPRKVVVELPEATCSRSILGQDTVASLVNQSPEARYRELLAATGLELPSLDKRADAVVEEAKEQADRALGRVGIAPLARRNSDALKHLKAAISPSLSDAFPSATELQAAAQLALDAAPGLTESEWRPEDHVVSSLIEAEHAIRDLLGTRLDPSDTLATLGRAAEAVRQSIDRRLAAREALQIRLNELRQKAGRGEPASGSVKPDGPDAKATSTTPAVPLALAQRWATHSSASEAAAIQFRADAASISAPEWRKRLEVYADALLAVAELAPVDELRTLSTPRATGAWETTRRTPAPPVNTVPPSLLAYGAVLDTQIADLDRLLAKIEGHPALAFAKQRDHVLSAVCLFELARQVKLAKPINEASRRLVSRLLAGRLAPAVRELVAAIVRFEWYFQPLLVADDGQRIVLGGLATSRSDLDARLLLNSAERSALGVAWFLALHLLQPPERRRVLVLDDPSANFDATNQAGLLSTLRAYVRLTRPEQFVLSTHDAATAATFAEDMAPIAGWPRAVTAVKVWRDGNDESATAVERVVEPAGSLEAESGLLGLV